MTKNQDNHADEFGTIQTTIEALSYFEEVSDLKREKFHHKAEFLCRMKRYVLCGSFVGASQDLCAH